MIAAMGEFHRLHGGLAALWALLSVRPYSFALVAAAAGIAADENIGTGGWFTLVGFGLGMSRMLL
jgi:hypothetical protein